MESKARHGAQVVEQFTRQAKGYAEMTEKYGSGYDPIELIDVGPDDIVLDVACGTGRLTLPLAARARHVTGLDITALIVVVSGTLDDPGRGDWPVAERGELSTAENTASTQ